MHDAILTCGTQRFNNGAMAAALDVPFDRLYIGGEWRQPRAGGTFADLDPSTREPIADVARGAGADVDDAVSAAREAADGWAKRSPAERGRSCGGGAG